MKEQDFVELPVSSMRDPEGRKFRETLRALSAFEKARAFCSFTAYFLCFVTILGIVLCAWPHLPWSLFRLRLSCVWGASLLTYLLAFTAEEKWSRALRRLAQELKGSPPPGH